MSAPALKKPDPAYSLIEDVLADFNWKSKSLITTIFGDSLWPWGEDVWLSSLIDLAGPFGLTERLVRTGVYRLSQEDWVTSKSYGRRAAYRITQNGLPQFLEAQNRLYAYAPARWDGRWQLVQILPALDDQTRKILRRELKYLGFGQIGPALFAHPSISSAIVRKALEQADIAQKILVFNALTEDLVTRETLYAVVKSAWEFEPNNTDFGLFIERFEDIETSLSSLWQVISDEAAFILRIVLMHEYRSLLLQAPQLPEELLPADWNGTKARHLCARLYHRLAGPANTHIAARLKANGDKNPSLNPLYWQRFGGLPEGPLGA